jgi:hypothetical protein
MIARFVTPLDGPERGHEYVLWPSGFRTYVPDAAVIGHLQELGHVDPRDVRAVRVPASVLSFYEELRPEYSIQLESPDEVALRA